MRPHGHASISRSKPRAQGICDRCGFPYTHARLQWQFDWIGARLQNKYILVCDGCRDVPQENIRTIVLPPDPMPIANPRSENFVGANNPVSPIGMSAAQLFPQPPNPYGDFTNDFDPFSFRVGSQKTFAGTLTGGGGPDAAFFGGPGKFFGQSATISPGSSFVDTNFITKNWNGYVGPVLPSSLALAAQGYVVNKAFVVAPIDTAFLGANLSTTIALQGSSDGANWTALGSVVTAGTKGEQVSISSASPTSYPFHRISITGDGSHAIGVAFIELSAAGPSIAQTGSELGA